ncbi:hypothetical protein LCM08_06345 [Salipiger pacificus]|nr:hypothetical protein [Alloyangia pacifica]
MPKEPEPCPNVAPLFSKRPTPPRSTITVERGGSLRLPSASTLAICAVAAAAGVFAVEALSSVSPHAARMGALFALGGLGVGLVLSAFPKRRAEDIDPKVRYDFQIPTLDDTAGPGSPLRSDMSANRWQRRMMDVARVVGSWSKDPNTKVGCVMVTDDRRIVATGYNGLPRGVADRPERMERPAKYQWTCHAEENAVANAASHGAKLDGTTCVATHFPCSSCARSLVNAGVKRVVTGGGATAMDASEFEVARTMFEEAGVEIVFLPDEE